MIEILETIRDFTETGGQVLLIIGGLIFVMWLMILERAMYVFVTHKQYKNAVIVKWKARQERSSWNAEQIRQAMISRVALKLGSGVPIIQSLVALSPWLRECLKPLSLLWQEWSVLCQVFSHQHG